MEDKYENSPTNQKGKVGVRVALRWLNQLLAKHDLLEYRDFQDDHVEGLDIHGINLSLVPAGGDKVDVATWLREVGDETVASELQLAQDEGRVFAPEMLMGGIEVKAYGYSTFTLTEVDPAVTYGHVYFPIRADDDDPGLSWLQRIAYPELDWRKKSVQPMALIIIYFLKENPIFSIAFEDITALVSRMEAIISPLKLRTLNLYSDAEINKALQAKHILRRKNLLYVPLNCLSDIATITMIGTIPKSFVPKDNPESVCPDGTQQAKMQHVKRCAGERCVDPRFRASMSADGVLRILLPKKQDVPST